ncbi:hypothetical protein H113_07967 [Trichophyton rubrum MR1459]|uniref:Uncharacterized protein n=1 Tax=Trichophyton rubrum (strain ATCC MYA-4607 / CBS 118892) TaxID=559305 RepID=A0A080WI42_TRIRC|nr:uncharacterized protein TERG_11575 [Trichophyton rubrum CBS 118892]EZF91002.1 hypothetical protein H113_07967 [Trichophyton rubrum MR1459]EZG02173.1 hypothetical protein H106_07745 [Trichophyton rubrum CBS 735.88]KFL60257.1 hypothetical protein TERG_11575 [Trichophyton rubrum CBS 118892]
MEPKGISNRVFSMPTIPSVTVCCCFFVILNHLVSRPIPDASSIIIYSAPTAFSSVADHPYTFGTGIPFERRNASVATSLAVAYFLGTERGYGILTTNCSPFSSVALRIRLKPPSPSFARLVTLAPVCLVTASLRAVTSNSTYLSRNRRSSLYKNRPDVYEKRSCVGFEAAIQQVD